MHAEFLSPDLGVRQFQGRSFVQAWFLGAHIDIGGGAQHDGFSLYPLQWMLLESLEHGLVLGSQPPATPGISVEDPLQLVFPRSGSPDLSSAKSSNELWEISYQNSLQFKLQDLRSTHRTDRHTGREAAGESHTLKVNQVNAYPNSSRKAFVDNKLVGYREDGNMLLGYK